MKEVLENLALIQLLDFCKSIGKDCSGTHLAKNGRGFKWSLVRDTDGLALVTVIFYKNRKPSVWVTN